MFHKKNTTTITYIFLTARKRPGRPLTYLVDRVWKTQLQCAPPKFKYQNLASSAGELTNETYRHDQMR